MLGFEDPTMADQIFQIGLSEAWASSSVMSLDQLGDSVVLLAHWRSPLLVFSTLRLASL